jgi:adenosine deaminase
MIHEPFLERLPKVELHVHLEGSMRPAVLLELARENGVDLPAADEEGLRRWFTFQSFAHFVDIYLTCSRALQKPEDFRLLALDFLAEQARQNVTWSEVHFTIGTHLANGLDGGEILDALIEAIAEGEKRLGASMRLIPDVVRNVGPAMADRTLEWALAGQARGAVVALGFTGMEGKFADEPFRPHFEAAKRAGLHTVAHAGEHAGPESIRSVLDVCGAERIGHGVRAVEDPVLVAELAARRIPLEICPTSNVCLGVFPDLASHPFDRLHRAGVPVTINSDDPPFFNTTLTDEYRKLGETFGYADGDLAAFALTAIESSFLPEAEKAFRAGEVRAALTRFAGRPLEERGWA